MLGAELFVQCLENEGVEYVFGLPGEEIADILKALAFSKKIRFILVKHEQSAAFMADVYGRLTGKAGVCLSTLGPGATNLLTGVADAYLDRAPLVAITGQGGLDRMYQESHQYIDVVSVYKFVTKWNRSITRAAFIPQVVRKAFTVAQSEKTGAVQIELPEDVAFENDVSAELLPVEPVHHPAVVEKDAAKRAASLIEKAKYPIILAGNGVIRSGASLQLANFAKRLLIPVLNTFMGKGVISANEELAIGTVGLQMKDLASCLLAKADLIITVGYDFVEYAPRFWNTNKVKILHIDSGESETDLYYGVSMELIGSIPETLDLLASTAQPRQTNLSYASRIRSMINNELSEFADDDSSFPLKPQRVVYELRRALSDEDILISDVGMHKVWIGRLYPAYSPNTVIISNGFASMGISIPGAIAAKLAKPERNVVAACGDGAFMMNLHELETAKRLGTNFVIVIFNDGQYSQIDWRQRLKFGESYFTKFENPDFEKLAESFGWKGIKIRNARELRDSLNHALDSKEFALIDVPVDASENVLLSARLGNNLVCPDE